MYTLLVAYVGILADYSPDYGSSDDRERRRGMPHPRREMRCQALRQINQSEAQDTAHAVVGRLSILPPLWFE
jgi:hypothetical protein